MLMGLFTGVQVGDAMDGHKRASVYFRVMCVNPYPKPSELRQAFMEARRDVSVTAVSNWFDLNRGQIIARFRDRRSALVRFVKLAIASELKVGRAPDVGDEGMDQWRQHCAEAWKRAKADARKSGLYYPKFVTTLLMQHAESSDPYVEHMDPFIVGDIEQEPAHLSESLVGMEAYWLLIIAVGFETVCIQEQGTMQCSKSIVNSGSLSAAKLIVQAQRKAYRINPQ
jgi:hypothetical protein